MGIVISDLIAALVFIIPMCFTPGPNNVLCAAHGSQYGVRNSLSLIAGMAVGWSILGLGIAAGATFIEENKNILQILTYIGAIYMVYLGYKIATSTKVDSPGSNKGTVSSGGGGTPGLTTTIGLIKSGATIAIIIVVLAAGADVYKMYDDHVNINLEDHVTDANFQLTEDKESIVGDIGFDIPKMGYFDKSIDVLIHLKILESDPTTEGDFTFEYTLGSGEKIYDKFELNNLDPVTKDKIDRGDPLDIEYTTTITVIYLGVTLDSTTSELGTKVSTVQTA